MAESKLHVKHTYDYGWVVALDEYEDGKLVKEFILLRTHFSNQMAQLTCQDALESYRLLMARVIQLEGIAKECITLCDHPDTTLDLIRGKLNSII